MPGAAWTLALILAGLAGGSLAGVLVTRLPAGEPVLLARSRCDTCGRVLRPLDLIPLLSWLALRGRCRGCGAAIGLRPLALEILGGLAGLGCALLFTDPLAAALALTMVPPMLAIAEIDREHGVVHDSLSLTLGLAALGWRWAVEGTPWPGLLSAALAFLAAEGGRRLYRRLRGRAGLGSGDVGLIAAAGATLRPTDAPLFLLTAGLLGLVVGLAARRHASEADPGFPFAPMLMVALAAVVVARGVAP